jgi:hypothetical protein
VPTNLFVPGEEAWNPDLTGAVSGHCFGDNHGFNPNTGAENSRVVLPADYDNALVIARQNPSVDTGSGQVKVGTPHINVSQNPNGSTHVEYRAIDPFSPGGEEIALASPWTVNGELVVKSTADGPIAAGIVSDFPAVEIYHHGVDGTSEMAKIMPENTTQFEPGARPTASRRLRHHDRLNVDPVFILRTGDHFVDSVPIVKRVVSQPDHRPYRRNQLQPMRHRCHQFERRPHR